MPPPLLHTRSGNEFDRPNTPTNNVFLSPLQTPQGSPSKHQLPPGAKELPNVFDNAMKLDPGTPTKQGKFQFGLGSPNKPGRQPVPEDAGEITKSPTNAAKKGTEQENTPPSARFGKEPASSTPAYAAVSRQEQYESTNRRQLSPLRGFTPEELEKLSLPKVKRLANVTQICTRLILLLVVDKAYSFRFS